jgi:hypothetical protein
LPNRSSPEGEMIRAYRKLHEYLSGRGLKPRLQKIDNECPTGLKRFMKQNEVAYQVVPRTSINAIWPKAPLAAGKII